MSETTPEQEQQQEDSHFLPRPDDSFPHPNPHEVVPWNPSERQNQKESLSPTDITPFSNAPSTEHGSQGDPVDRRPTWTEGRPNAVHSSENPFAKVLTKIPFLGRMIK